MAIRYPTMSSLLAFEAAGRLGSFGSAATELSMSQSTVSYRIQKLEDDLGVLLFVRLTRQVRLTPEGEKFLKVASRVLKQLRQGIEPFDPEMRQSLVVTLSTYLASRWLSPRLANWTRRNNGSDVHLNHDFREAEQSSDIIIHWAKDARKRKSTFLMATDQTPYCTPEIAAGLKKPRDVLNHPLLAAEPHMDVWAEWMKAAELSNIKSLNTIIMPDSNVRIMAASDGLGIVLGNQFTNVVNSSNDLVRPFEISVKGPGFYYSIHSTRPQLAERFVNWLKKQAAITAESDLASL